MIKNLLILLSLFGYSTLLLGQSTCDFIDKVQSYQKNIKIKLQSHNFILDSSTFDLGTYLSLFDKLKVDSGKICNVYYEPSALEGEPIIYVIPDTLNLSSHIKKIVKGSFENRSPYLNLYQDTNGLSRSILYDFVHYSKIRASNNITPENSEYGLFQYLFFYVMGEQFALIGHSNYDQRMILCNKLYINQIIEEYTDNEMFKVDKKRLESIRYLNPVPVITLNESIYKISWYELWTHSGLYLRTFEIVRKPPYEIRPIKTEEIFRIDLNFEY